MFKKLSLFTVLALTLFTSCGKDTTNISIPGVKGPNLNLIGDNLVIDAVIENLAIDGGARISIPKMDNSFVEVSPDLQSDGTLIGVTLALSDVLNGDLASELDPATLPNGRPLPGVAGGVLPALAFSVEKFDNMVFYVGPKVFGVFIPVPTFDMNGGVISSRYFVKGERVGNIHIIGNDSGTKNGGILLMLDLTTQVVGKLKKYMKNN